MEKIKIHGPSVLKGEVEISGAKNAAVGILPATLMVKGISTISNLPDISDVRQYCQIMEELGAKVERIDAHTIKVDSRELETTAALSENVKKFRASYYLLGALLGRTKNAIVGMPGGCNIGERPIDLHIKGFEAMGAEVGIEEGYIALKAEKLKGAQIYMDVVSVGATINVMLAATLAEGTTIIENAAKEPHIVDVANYLNTMGANIKGAGTDIIRIKGVEELVGDGSYSVVPDQIEAGTFMVAAAISKGEVLIKNCIPKHMESLTAKLIEMGAKVEDRGDAILVSAQKRLKKVHIKTLPYPGFPTDLQSQMGVALAVADGSGSITEGIWEARFTYVRELKNMGADVDVKDKRAIFRGVETLKGTVVHATDLRAGAALILAGIIAEGTTEIRNIEHIDRGYENIEEKFKMLGAKIERVRE